MDRLNRIFRNDSGKYQGYLKEHGLDPAANLRQDEEEFVFGYMLAQKRNLDKKAKEDGAPGD